MAHFYEQTAAGVEARHYVPLVSRPEELRPTRMSDVRKWTKEGRVVVPSVTTVLNVLAKPALQNWYVEQHLKLAFNLAHEFDNTDTEEHWIAEVRRLTELEMDKAPTAGGDLHKSLELYTRRELKEEHPDWRLCFEVSDAVMEYTGCGSWETETRFVSALGFGGQTDLSSQDWLVDYKTKQTVAKFKPGKMVYDEHRMQLAAYREGLGLPKARCANVFICIEDGQIDFHEHKEDELQRGWRMFQNCLAIWNEQNRLAA